MQAVYGLYVQYSHSSICIFSVIPVYTEYAVYSQFTLCMQCTYCLHCELSELTVFTVYAVYSQFTLFTRCSLLIVLTVYAEMFWLGGVVTLHVAGPAGVGPRVTPRNALHHEAGLCHKHPALAVLAHLLALRSMGEGAGSG